MTTFGLSIRWSPADRAWLVLWLGRPLAIRPTRREAQLYIDEVTRD